MAKKGLKWNKGAMQQLRNTRESQNLLNELAGQVADKASENGRVNGYKVTPLALEDPRNATSVLASGHARRHNRKNHALIRALGDIAD